MNRLLRSPILWLCIAAVLVGLLLFRQGKFEYRLTPDTPSYLLLVESSLTDGLNSSRTLGYPLFLKALRMVSQDYRAVTMAQYAVHVLSVLVFYGGLRRLQVPPSAAGVAAAAILFSKSLFELVPEIMTDSLSISLAVIAVSTLFYVLANPRNPAAWCALILSTAATYHVRPAYLFLIPLLPLLGFWLRALVLPRANFNGTVRLVFGLSAATLVPLLAFCGLRLLFVGHFGLVSFGGYNIAGIAVQFVDDDLVRELPEGSQELARQVLARRETIENWEPPSDFYAMGRMYNPTVWEICFPAAQDVEGDDAVRINQALNDLSRATIRRRPSRYVRWLAWAFREGLASLAFLSVVNKPAQFCLLVLILLQGVELLRRRVPSWTIREPLDESSTFLPIHVLFWVALGFGLTKMMLVILVEPPLHRYITPATIFSPALFAVLCWARCRQVVPELFTSAAVA